MFGRLFDLSATNSINLESVISFPILPETACSAPTAVNRWAVSASMKSKQLNAVLDYADMNLSYDELKESHVSRIRAEHNRLSKFKKSLKQG